MANRNWSAAKDQRAKSARENDHWGARMASMTPPKFKPNDTVRIKRNGVVTVVEEDTDKGYRLRGYPGCYFPPYTIEKV